MTCLWHEQSCIYIIFKENDLFLFPVQVTEVEMQQHYDEFFEEVFVELEDKVYMLQFTHVSAKNLSAFDNTKPI